MVENGKVGRPRKYEKESTGRTEANKRWQEKNKEHAKYLQYRSMARSFARKFATEEDMAEINQLFAERSDN